VLPAFYLAFVYLTFATLRRVGLSPTPSVPPGDVTTFRHHLYSLLILSLLLFAVLVTLATLLPFHFVGPADPYATPVGVRPPWYMLAPYAIFQRAPFPAWLSGFLLLAAAIAVLLLPWWARERGPFDERRVRAGGIAALVLWTALSAVGFLIDRR
jgi:quinol-cytochrome oxidoreductase complex cytochrome b subunit